MVFKRLTSALFAGLIATSAVAQENVVVHYDLVLIFRMADGTFNSQVRNPKDGYRTVRDCEEDAKDIHRLVTLSSDILDVGTMCLKSEFEDSVKRKV